MLNPNLFANYERWKLILSKSVSSDTKSHLQNCDNFLKQFPFSSKIWGQYAHLKFSLEGRDSCLLVYREALRLSPNFLPLHLSFCLWVEDSFKEDSHFVDRTFRDSLQKVAQNFEVDRLYTFYIKYLLKKSRYQECNDVFWTLLEGNMFNIKNFISK